jgi:PAS domain S-box-containing protein
MHFRLTLSRKALLLVAVPLAFELAFIFILIGMLQQLEIEREREAHARDVTMHLNKTLRYLLEGGSDSVLAHLTGSAAFESRFRKVNDLLREEGLILRDLVRKDPSEIAAMGAIDTLLNDCNSCLDVVYRQSLTGDKNAAFPAYFKMHALTGKIFATADGLIAREQAIEQAEAQALTQARHNVRFYLLAGVVANIIMAVLLALYFNAGTAKRLKHLMNNVVKFGLRQELDPSQPGEDEIAHLDQVFYDMATALASARRKENAIIENAVDVICSVESDGHITAINPAVRKVWGYSPEEVVGSRVSFIIKPEDVEDTLGALDKAVTERSPVTFENRIKRKDGSFADMLWSASWSPAERSLFCIAHDITERKEIERLKQDFVDMISHDLRTPLTSVQGFLSLLQAGAYNELSKPGQESLSFAETSITRLIQLVNDLLDLEKMEAGRLELRRTQLFLPDLVEDAVNSMQGFAKQQAVIMQYFAPRNCPEVLADQARLAQVVVNLLSNAIKFSPQAGSVTVRVFERGAFVEVDIEDEGRGVPKELRGSIFEKFTQVEQPADEQLKGGSGLGLAICKAIIEQHGGHIGVREREPQPKSKSGEDLLPKHAGSCFWFQIPKASDAGRLAEEMGSTVS